VRHRTASNTQSNSKTTNHEHDPWLDTPHDIDSSTSLETPSFQPTSVYWISPHGMLTKSITVLDLSKDMDVPYTGMSKEYKAHVRIILKDHSFTPTITCKRTSWVGLKYNITDAQDEHIAHWSHPWTSGGSAILTFPEDSAHCPHNLELRNKRWGMRTESFTLNSQPYLWEPDSFWHSTDMTLYKVFGTGDAEKRVVIGKYAQKCWSGFVTGGTVVVDEQQLDGVVALLTLIVVLKKKRQRAAERRHAGE
jgi:hypothetical protein